MKKFFDRFTTIAMTAFLAWGIASWLNVVFTNATENSLAAWNLFEIIFG